MKSNSIRVGRRLKACFCFIQQVPGLCAVLVLMLQLAAPVALAADALDRSVTLDIAPNTRLEDALIEWGTKAGVGLMVNTTTIAHHITHGIRGTLRARDALSELLRDTGLSYTSDGERVKVMPTAALVRSSLRGDDQERRQATIPSASGSSMGGERNADDVPEERTSNDVDQKEGARDLAQVIVTAEKRQERLQDVPIPVTAISADSLLESNQLRLQDYSSAIPGLNVTPSSYRGGALLAIRGVTTGDFGTPTVGVTIDDVPFGSNSNLGPAIEVPDLDPNDLARIEVLRGPQGTLYGASSIGGLFKFVTVDPTTDRVSYRIQAGTNNVSNGAEWGYDVRGSVNVPITDTFAVRASAFNRQDPGYIDNVQTGQDGINKAITNGGRLSALWRASDALSLKLSALIQHVKADGSSFVDVIPGLGDLQQSDLRGTGGYDKTHQLYSATLKAQLGWATLDVISGYGLTRRNDVIDLSQGLGRLGPKFIGPGVTGAANVESYRSNKFTQEIRLSGSIEQKIDWLFGGFYTHESHHYEGDIEGIIPSSDAVAGTFLITDIPSTFEEYAAFADFTYHFTDRFDVQLGGREAKNKQTVTQNSAALLVTPLWQGDSEDSSFTYLLTPRLRLTPDFMIYARVASGYRPGGFNPYFAQTNTPSSFGPDKTRNYEIGAKADSFDHKLSVDTSVYYIDWSNIQLFEYANNSNGGYTGNVGAAKSQGIELSTQAHPASGLTLGAWVTWNEAVLTRAFPPQSTSFGLPGDRLPFGSRFSGSASVEEQFPMGNDWSGVIGGMVSYVGFRQGDFQATERARENFSPYARVDLRAGIDYRSGTLNLFANNVTNRLGVTSGALIVPGEFWHTIVQPRTVGMSLSFKF